MSKISHPSRTDHVLLDCPSCGRRVRARRSAHDRHVFVVPRHFAKLPGFYEADGTRNDEGHRCKVVRVVEG